MDITSSPARPPGRSATPDRDSDSNASYPNPNTNGGSPEILTPGRKIRALMAALDSDSDDETPTNATAPTATATTQKRVARPLFTSFAEAMKMERRVPEKKVNVSDNAGDGSGDDGDDDLPVQPKGRMAARMQAQAAVDGEGERGGGESAYERVSRELNVRGRSGLPVVEDMEGGKGVVVEEEEEQEDIRTGRRLERGLGRNGRSTSNRSISPLFVPMDSPMGRERERRSVSRASARSESPLFVPMDSPRLNDRTATGDAMHTDDEEPAQDPRDRLKALVAKKRQEREAREKLEAEKKAERLQRSSELGNMFSSDQLSDADDEVETGEKLMQHSRPSARKASKKALLEMNRETQRISRNMQLAHQATTKKKITLDSFLEKFNSKSLAPTSSSVLTSDREHSTPPTSPVAGPSLEDKNPAANIENTQEHTAVPDDDLELPSVDDILAAPVMVAEAPVSLPKEQIKALSVAPAPKISNPRAVRVRISRQSIAQNQKNDSDSDLEIVTSPAKTRRIAVFENLPTRNASTSTSLLKLRTLAQLTSPSRQKQSSMTRTELDNALFRRARLQALKEREEKIEELRAKGVVIETAEERMRADAEVEDLLERAREEAAAIAKREKKAAKKNGDVDALDVDDSEDEDYNGGDDKGEVLSGSEQEEVAGDDEEEQDSEAEDDEELDDADRPAGVQDEAAGHLIDNEAGEAEDSEDEQSEEEEHQVKGTDEQVLRRNRRTQRVISDDEDEAEDAPKLQETPIRSQSQPLFPGFGGAARTPIMGLTQAFGATFADSQDDEEDSLEVLRRMPGAELPADDLLALGSQEIVRDSQGQNSVPLDLFASYPQSASRVSESPAARTIASYSQAPEPTQDAGFMYSPFDQGKRFNNPPTSTVDTVPIVVEESPIVKRTGGRRLLRRGPVSELSDVEEEEFLVKSSAFDVMRKAAKKSGKIQFDKSKSVAREIIDEVAEESEDEYAGLGGASDESAGEEDELDLSMINDNSGEVVDEKQLAAMNANHSRERDEQQVNKLMRDITTGALRRRRGAGDDLDLSDSDDERTAARRRAKRREFAKMRKALLADEKIGQIAVDPKKSAFLKTIEDRDMDDDMSMDFLDSADPSSQDTPSQDPAPQQGSDQPESGGNISMNNNNNKRKRPLDHSAADALNRPPPHLRRTPASATTKKPTTLAEIRESVSFLLDGDESNSSESFNEDILLSDDEEDPPHAQDASEEDDEIDVFSKSNNNPPSSSAPEPTTTNGTTNPRRLPRGKVIDRLSLRRAASSNAASTTISKQAFFSTNTGPTFKRPPPLIRRATSNLSSTSSTSSSSTGVTGGGGGARASTELLRPQGAAAGKKGAVNYYAAARERQREWELRRAADRESGKGGVGVKGRGGGVLGGLLGGGGGGWE
ncbi:hypothetical protein FQN50_004157 [Emmonsiellopsis sp. PD_5]|nr:hypothetical protein FQN50_004157 [Emmonsiellopsis sp. PD_5]